MKDILFSSTRQWNPGDEFILFGIRNILEEMDIKYNPILFNRHPLLDHKIQCDKKGHDVIPQFFDNSFIECKESLSTVDYVIFAGTPEWTGEKLTQVFDLLEKKNIKFSMIGVGGYNSLTKEVENLLKKDSEILLGRDKDAYYCLKKFGGKLEVCPAIFASKKEFPKTELNRIGICFQYHDYCAAPKKEVYAETIKLYKKIMLEYNVSFICHTFVDFMEAKSVFPSSEILYSSYAEDYLSIYKKFDLVIGTRVHGSGISSSMGIPSITIPHDYRAETVKLFLSPIMEPRKIIDHIKKIDIEKESKKLIEYKQKKKEEYKKYFSKMSLFKQ